MSSLTNMATLIRREHEAVAGSAKKALEHAIAAGELLIEAKKQVRHGEWLPWLGTNCEISERTAQAYMRLARMKTATVADLPLRAALKAIASRPRYELTCCGEPAPCNCGADFVSYDESGKEVGRVPVRPIK